MDITEAAALRVKALEFAFRIAAETGDHDPVEIVCNADFFFTFITDSFPATAAANDSISHFPTIPTKAPFGAFFF